MDGQALQVIPFVERRKILSHTIIPNDRIRISDFVEEKEVELFQKIKSIGLEGMMAKRKSSRYMVCRLAIDQEYKNSGLCSDRNYKR